MQPGDTVELVSDAGAADPSEIASPLALASVSAIVFFTDDEGQPGIVSAVGRVPDVPDRASLASLVIRQFTIARRQHQGRFLYWPKLTLAETSGRSRASIRKIVFELLDVGAAGQAQPVWSAPVVPAGDTISLDTGKDGRAPWFEIESSADASRVVGGDLVRGRRGPRRPGQRHRARIPVGSGDRTTMPAAIGTPRASAGCCISIAASTRRRIDIVQPPGIGIPPIGACPPESMTARPAAT